MVYRYGVLIRVRLHWLPAPQRIVFKLCRLLTFKSLRGMVPRHLADLCCSTSAETGCNLRCATHGDLRLRKMCTKFGDRAFSVAGPRAWNKLQMDIRSVEFFKRKLERHLFCIVYGF